MKVGEDFTFEFEPDVIFYMSMQRHLGLPPYLNRAKTIIYELNGDDPIEVVLSSFSDMGFSMLKDLGMTGEDGRHTYILCKK